MLKSLTGCKNLAPLCSWKSPWWATQTSAGRNRCLSPQIMVFHLMIAQEARAAVLLRELVFPLTPSWCQQSQLKASPAPRRSRELCLMGQHGLILPVQRVWIKEALLHPATALPSSQAEQQSSSGRPERHCWLTLLRPDHTSGLH